MATWTTIPDSDVDAESPVTEGLAKRWRDNPRAVAAGDATVPYAEKILVPTALRTAETNTAKIHCPDGAGGTRWADRGEVASNLVADAYVGEVVLSGFTGPLEVDIFTKALNAARQYHLSVTIIGEVYQAGTTPTGVPNFAFGAANVAVNFSRSLIMAYPFPLNFSIATGEVIEVVVSGTNLKLRCRVNSSGGFPVASVAFNFHRAEWAGIEF